MSWLNQAFLPALLWLLKVQDFPKKHNTQVSHLMHVNEYVFECISICGDELHLTGFPFSPGKPGDPGLPLSPCGRNTSR